ncbi:mRNA turnover and ribosome assembly protein [Saxophila tyrrhenica]|uniref:Ribosome assembly factor mrt4 n=1 Tax=Saxophila tyrrhenica TaxID=1690608 RepID=A0AAV9P4F5_9PEZI|nr:mRNA turnover and ribosome assembly protein [Saxophila tyrrhenica]
MPRSKRSRLVHTSRIAKVPSRQKSASQYASLRAAIAAYPSLFLFSVSNMRNTYLKEIRQNFASDGRLFFGKTKVMAKALGLTPEEEAEPGLSGLARYLQGNVGVLCTERSVEETMRYLEEFVEVDFARAGIVAPRSFTVPAGVVYSTGGEVPQEEDVPSPHSLEQTLRKWGMPTRLEKGRVVLDQEFVVCEEGKALDSHQTALLKVFGVAVAEFRVRVVAWWSKENGEVRVVDEGAVDGEGVEDMDED